MSVVVKAYLCAGVALAGAAGVVVTPLPRPTAPARVSSTAYTLTAASENVGVNLLNMVRSVPAWEVQAMGRLADAMIATGSWQVWGPTNVLGFDEQDPPKLAAMIDMLIPIQPFSSVLGDQLNWWARANLPMNAGCAAAQGACPDAQALLSSTFTVPARQLNQGYQFPVVTNPFTGVPTSWSGQYVKLDRGAAMTSLRAYLTGPPAGVATVSAADVSATVSRLAKSVKDAFYPFVQNSQWFDDKNTILAPLFRSLAPALCKSCDPVDPYDNPWLKNYSVKPAAAVDLPEVTGTHHSAQTPVADAVTAIPARARAATTVRQSASRGRSGKPGSASAR